MNVYSRSFQYLMNKKQFVFIFLIIIIVYLLPFTWFMSNYSLYVLTLAAIYAMPATGLTLFMGYTGQLSVGHAAFYGIGGYMAANLSKMGIPFTLAILIGSLSSGLIGFVLGLIALRLRGFALAMTTLALGLVSYQVFKNFTAFTGGVSGLGQIPVANIIGKTISTRMEYYYLSVSILLIVMVIAIALVRSPTGRAMRAIAANELAAQSLGINTYLIKCGVFALSTAFAGLAGGLYAHLIRYITPDDFGLHFSILFLTMAIVGGLQSVIGGLIGSTVITIVAEEMRAVPWLQPILYGGLLILLVLFMPFGIVGAVNKLYIRLTNTQRFQQTRSSVMQDIPDSSAIDDQSRTSRRVEP